MTDQTGLNIGELKRLKDLLSRSPMVIRRSQTVGGGDIEEIATEAAAGLLDIRKSAEVLFEELLPRLLAPPSTEADFEDALGDIAEEYRHIWYHIANSRLFNHVIPGP